MGEVVEFASLARSAVPSPCPKPADGSGNRDDVTMELTEQFVCLVRRMMDAGYTLDDVVGFMHEQAELLHRISMQLAEHGRN
jgi:hypothetical protein